MERVYRPGSVDCALFDYFNSSRGPKLRRGSIWRKKYVMCDAVGAHWTRVARTIRVAVERINAATVSADR